MPIWEMERIAHPPDARRRVRKSSLRRPGVEERPRLHVPLQLPVKLSGCSPAEARMPRTEHMGNSCTDHPSSPIDDRPCCSPASEPPGRLLSLKHSI